MIDITLNLNAKELAIKKILGDSIIKKNNRNNSPDSFFSKNDAQLLSTPKKMIKVTKSISLLNLT